MIVKRWLSRPRWEHRSVSVRRESVAHDNDATLVPLLAGIARNDDDTSVRTAALRRVADLALAQERAHDDPDSAVRAVARTLYLDLLGGRHPSSPPLADRLRLLRAIDDKAVWVDLLRRGAEAELREAALDRDPRPGLLVERTLEDPDPEFRLRLLARIDDSAVLSRIAEHARRRDKRLHRAARERLDTLRVDAGDEAALASAAEHLCRRLEAAAAGNALSGSSLEDADRGWERLAGCANPALAVRYTNARAQCQAALASMTPTAMPTTVVPRSGNAAPESLHPSAPVESPVHDVQRLAAEVRFQASIASSLDHAEPRPKPQPVRDAGLEFRLQQLESALDRGELRSALEIEQALAERRIDQGKLSARWRSARARGAELQRWQLWSTRRQRRQLCNEVAQLRDSGLHPDALATRLRELHEAWANLDAMEARAAPSPADAALHKRFQSLCHRALGPAQTYFKQREQLRQHKGDEIRACIDEVTSMDADNEDWAAMSASRRRLAAARRELGTTEPRQRKSLATALQAAIDTLDQRLAAHHAELESARERLLGEAREIHTLATPQRARCTRELQRRWQQLGPGRPDHDRKQWQAFRRICNDVFAGLDDQRKHAAAEREQKTAAARQLLSELASIESSDIEVVQRQRRDLDVRWRDLQVRDPALQTQWRATVSQLEQKIAQLQRLEWRAQFESLPDVLAGAEPTSALLPELRTALDLRSSAPADSDKARDVLVRLEALADIDSPEVDQDRRVALRLQRLQAVLGERRHRDTRAEFVDLLRTWIELGPPTADAAELDSRFRRAFKTLLDVL